MSLWFEIVLTVYGFIFLIILMKISGCCDYEEEMTEEMRSKLYS
jgi:hypothetical protein